MVAATEHRVGDSCRDAEIESIGLDIKRLSAELETAKLEGAKDARKIAGLVKDWERARRESATLAAEVNAQRARIVDLELERDRDIRRASRAARCDVVQRYSEILSRLKVKWVSKEKETFTRIHLQEVVANIDLLNELGEGDLDMEKELTRLKEMEKYCESLVALAATSDWSPSGLDLPQVFEDSVDQDEGSSADRADS